MFQHQYDPTKIYFYIVYFFLKFDERLLLKPIGVKTPSSFHNDEAPGPALHGCSYEISLIRVKKW